MADSWASGEDLRGGEAFPSQGEEAGLETGPFLFRGEDRPLGEERRPVVVHVPGEGCLSLGEAHVPLGAWGHERAGWESTAGRAASQVQAGRGNH